ncbi:hypothetical protein DERF_000433 [Dermatophagoides farinae]|uniref:Uncharacterized protein n=1 Tax=Dermatophagoides farinae TaxID=6954 RepID=A0A922IA53_DERFA|nr:uncharacterized protein LOC124496284 [Dermatophagoides farinae]KAH7640771.1 hypothetical protein HUG17_8240 [Dermatophagoides farinae]KAH9526335.1 hypothetical protein DERF_000433 [Dermatophagoides farinae]
MKPKNSKPIRNQVKKMKNKFEEKIVADYHRSKKDGKRLEQTTKKADSGDEEIFYEICSDTNYSKLFNDFQEFIRQHINNSFGIKIDDTGLNFEHFIQLLNQCDGNLEEMMKNFRLDFRPQILVVKNHNVCTLNEQNLTTDQNENETLLFGDNQQIEMVDAELKKIDNKNADSTLMQPTNLTNEETYIYPNELSFKF